MRDFLYISPIVYFPWLKCSIQVKDRSIVQTYYTPTTSAYINRLLLISLVFFKTKMVEMARGAHYFARASLCSSCCPRLTYLPGVKVSWLAVWFDVQRPLSAKPPLPLGVIERLRKGITTTLFWASWSIMTRPNSFLRGPFDGPMGNGFLPRDWRLGINLRRFRRGEGEERHELAIV